MSAIEAVMRKKVDARGAAAAAPAPTGAPAAGGDNPMTASARRKSPRTMRASAMLGAASAAKNTLGS